jgi:hypothetical protein
MPTPASPNRQELRSRFSVHALLTEADFAALIDAGLNQADDGLLRLPDHSLGLVRQVPNLPLLRLFADPLADTASWQLRLHDGGGGDTPGLGLAGPRDNLALLLDGQGNLGLGTGRPKGRLHLLEATGSLASESTASLVIEHGDPGGGGSLLFRHSDAPEGAHGFIEYRDANPALDGDPAALLTLGLRKGSRDHLALMPSGNVGIHTTTPSARLHVAGSLRVDADLTIAAGQELLFADDGQIRSFDNSHRLLFRRSANTMELREAGDIVFSPGSSGDETAAVVMGRDGKVGIGTRAPEARLQVQGDAAFSGAIDLLIGSNPLRLAANTTTFSDGALNRAEIANDTDRYRCLMILGNRSAGAKADARRQVGLWDDLTVAGTTRAAAYRLATQGFEFGLTDGILTPILKTRVAFSYTGAHQILVVPGDVHWIFLKLWGAGGGGGRAGGWGRGADGGGGGHTRGLFPVTPGDTLIVVVGRGGTTANSNRQSYGGGGTNGGGNTVQQLYAGHGGGYCGVFIKNTVSAATALAIAGGGGGGGSSRAWTGNVGGAGGGLTGQRGASPYDGRIAAAGAGGTQSAGGAGGSLQARNGSSGSALQGGAGAPETFGGGGGGGYFGGGGGAYNESNTMGGGGGGSGFAMASGLLTGTYTGEFRNVAYSWDPDLLSNDNELIPPGFGGSNPQNTFGEGQQSGGHGRAVIYY